MTHEPNQDGKDCLNTDMNANMTEAATNATSYQTKEHECKTSKRSLSFDLQSEYADIREVRVHCRKHSTSSQILPFEICLDSVEQNRRAEELRNMECQSQQFDQIDIRINETETNFCFTQTNSEPIEEESFDLKVNVPDSQKMRMKYLSKLSKEQIWLPPLK